jgi:D-arabinose 1-dehydrogenase-like Zn-dependent alcohol dehydrogenase
MGTYVEFARFLRFVSSNHIKPVIDRTYKLKDAQAAFERLAAGEQTGKLVIEP